MFLKLSFPISIQNWHSPGNTIEALAPTLDPDSASEGVGAHS